MKKFSLAKIMSMIHLIFFLSVFCFGTMFLTVGVLALPALASAFAIGKKVIYGEYNVYDKLYVSFFGGIKDNIGMMRYLPLELLGALQFAGMWFVTKSGSELPEYWKYISYAMLACAAFIMTLLVYISAVHVLYSRYPKIVEAIIVMFYKVYYLLVIWACMVLILCFFGSIMAGIFLIAGEVVLLIFEAVAFIDILFFKKLRGELTEEDEEKWQFLKTND